MTVVSSEFGSFQVVADEAARDAIPTPSRVEGMLVHVVATGSSYRLGSGLTNSDWSQALSGDTTETTLYVDTVAGDDGYTGLVSAPLATIQEAINRFIPPHKPAPFWSRSEVYTISVVYTPGMPAITERIHIPYRRGEGTLRIVADEEEVYTGLNQSGALSQGGVNDSDGYYVSHYTMNCTTSPFVANSLTDGYFVRVTTNVNDHTIELMYDQAAIVDNETNSLDIVTYDPGTYLGFGFGNNIGFDVVRPQIEWTFPNDQAFTTYVGDSLITIDGGINEITGFRFAGPANNYSRAFVASRAPVSGDAVQIQNAVMRCTFEAINAPFIAASGNSMALAGCYFDIQGSNGATIFGNGNGCNIYASRINHNTSALSIPVVFEDVQGAQVAGLSYRGNDATVTSNTFGLYVRRATGTDIVLGLDMRNSRNGVAYFDSFGNLSQSSFGDMSGTGVSLTGGRGLIDNVTSWAGDVGIKITGILNATISNCELFLCDDGLELTDISLFLSSTNIYNCNRSAIVCINNCNVDVGSTVSGTGNGEYAVELLRVANSARVSSSSTLSGSLGDCILGRDAGGPVVSFAGGDASNSSTLNILTIS